MMLVREIESKASPIQAWKRISKGVGGVGMQSPNFCPLSYSAFTLIFIPVRDTLNPIRGVLFSHTTAEID